MIEEIHFVSHVDNGIHIIKYNYTYSITNMKYNYSYTCMNSIFENVAIEKHFSRPFKRYIICYHYQKSFH